MFDGNVNNEVSFLPPIKPYFTAGKSPSTDTFKKKKKNFTNTQAWIVFPQRGLTAPDAKKS